ncbi:Hypothetical predicted protein [Mytilus galloprovincialis]|uniref:Uncharacterized protein n=1 Tax=Mytilus galloprovincialis TaxID=29158 RepID=A0A8B6GN41_MYTGA|nr:Hypothetical predicted protein [Mytilus galloprovincialis]
MSKLVQTEWDRFCEGEGMKKTTLTASRNRKVAVSTLRESGATREEAIVLAKHMAHNVATADKYYDQSRRVEGRHAVLDKLGQAFKDAAAKGQQQDEPMAGGSGVVPSRAEREQNLEELVVERSKVETGRPDEDTRQKKKKKAPRFSKWNEGLLD